MTPIAGRKNRAQFILDAAEAWYRGRQLDLMLARSQRARPRGVTRGTHAASERLDAARSVEGARRLNRG